MWIRSQNKTILINLNEGLYICKRYKKSEPTFQIENRIFVAGEYSTEEKAIEVLDEIHRRLFVIEQVKIMGFENTVDCSFIPFVDKTKDMLKMKVANDIDIFQMPLDEDVEEDVKE